jgi:hypothetical protein
MRNVLTKGRYAACKLFSNACDKFTGISSISNVSTTSSEEKADPKSISVKVLTGDVRAIADFPVPAYIYIFAYIIRL